MALGWIDFFKMLFNFMLLSEVRVQGLIRKGIRTHFVKRHPVLDKEPYTRIQEADITLEHKVSLGLG